MWVTPLRSMLRIHRCDGPICTVRRLSGACSCYRSRAPLAAGAGLDGCGFVRGVSSDACALPRCGGREGCRGERGSDMAGGLVGKVAVVTGGGRGIGRSTAVALAREGADILAASRTMAELRETAALVTAEGRRCEIVRADITVEADCISVIDAAMDRFGGVDILVNNAGGARFHRLAEMSVEDFDYTLNVNLRSTFLCSRAVLPVMLRQGTGEIVNVASSAARKPYVEQGAYCAAKAGVVALSHAMALELRDQGIRVHTVCPGGVATRMADEVHPARSKSGWIQPEDVARAIVFLVLSPGNITVDDIVIRRTASDPLW